MKKKEIAAVKKIAKQLACEKFGDSFKRLEIIEGEYIWTLKWFFSDRDPIVWPLSRIQVGYYLKASKRMGDDSIKKCLEAKGN